MDRRAIDQQSPQECLHNPYFHRVGVAANWHCAGGVLWRTSVGGNDDRRPLAGRERERNQTPVYTGDGRLAPSHGTDDIRV